MTISEKDTEQKFIQKLQDLKFVYRPDIKNREDLERNFREKFEQLNKVHLTDDEFERLLSFIITPDVFSASKLLRKTHTFIRDDGTPLDFMLVNIKDWCKNSFEVVNQLRINNRSSYHIYDVIILINGIPLVQIELKSLKKEPRKAMEQIIKYKKDKDNGYENTLLAFMQIFVVSNETDTWYFANNNNEHFQFDVNEQYLPIYRLADRDNRKITNLYEFSDRFFAKCELAEIISRYMVLVETEKKILMMRPYQIYAVKEILKTVNENRGNGYIWHTTGSGKTLTSFKASTLLKENPNIEKCVFVVDRKDLDKQTRDEFNKFQPDCVEENTNTAKLVERLLSRDYKDKVIVTTIQKLGVALDEDNRRQFKKMLEPLRDKRMVFIFDECHRSQFGENHKAIKEFFPKAQLFGFTGTPIFEENSTYQFIKGRQAKFLTTDDVFQKLLHAYTITHAIEDRNVLRFRIEYYKPEKVINPNSSEFKNEVVKTIIEKHDRLTDYRRFNAIFATNKIDDAIEYYNLFKDIQNQLAKEDPDYEHLNITCVFTPPADVSSDVRQLQEDLPQEIEDNQKEPNQKKQALEKIIQDYNQQYGTNFSIYDFDKYYQDVQLRIKNQKYPNSDFPRSKKIDITIVVDMLLTGFDSKYLNTLYVDKNLKYHRLIQAFSRTNRVLNKTKPYGNIIDFRGQRDEVDKAVALFSGIKPDKAKEIWLVEPAETIINRFEQKVDEFKNFMFEQGLDPMPSEVYNIKGDEAKAQFVRVFREIQSLSRQLQQYTDLTEEQEQIIEQSFPQEELIAFRSAYLDIAREFRKKNLPDDNPLQNEDFDLILFDEAIIDYDYIMKLIARLSQTEPDKMELTRQELIDLIRANAKFIDETEDLIDYVNSIETGKPLNEKQIIEGYEKFKQEKYQRLIKQIAQKHNVDKDRLKQFAEKVTDRLVFDEEALSGLFPNASWREKNKLELALMKDLLPVLKKIAKGQDISGVEYYEREF